MLRFTMYRSGVLYREWRWRLRASNGRKIAVSGEGYRNKADRRAAIELIRLGGASAHVIEQSTT